MSNLHPTKDKIGTPLCNVIDDNNQFRKKVQHLQFCLKQIDLAYEGYLRCTAYANANISEQLRNEGEIQKRVYNILFCEALEELGHIWKEMCTMSSLDMEGN